MRRSRLMFSLVATLALAVSALAGPASADPPAALSGTYQQVPETGQVDMVRETGKVTHVQLSVETLHSGAVSGSSLDTFTCKILEGRDSFRCQGRGAFTGTVAGVTGTGTMRTKFSGTCSQTTTVCEGTVHFHGLDGALARVHGTSEIRDAGFFPARSGSAEIRLHRH
jgi:hypothetical protein